MAKNTPAAGPRGNIIERVAKSFRQRGRSVQNAVLSKPQYRVPYQGSRAVSPGVQPAGSSNTIGSTGTSWPVGAPLPAGIPGVSSSNLSFGSVLPVVSPTSSVGFPAAAQGALWQTYGLRNGGYISLPVGPDIDEIVSGIAMEGYPWVQANPGQAAAIGFGAAVGLGLAATAVAGTVSAINRGVRGTGSAVWNGLRSAAAGPPPPAGGVRRAPAQPRRAGGGGGGGLNFSQIADGPGDVQNRNPFFTLY